MRILLINPPGKTSFISPPLGLMYLAASLRTAGHQPLILDYLLEKFDKDSLFKTINQGVELIGITAVSPLIKNALYLADLIKKNFPQKTIILGGPHPTLLPKETLKKARGVDYIIKGEGEKKLNLFIQYLEGKKSKEDLDGVVFRDKNKIIDLPQKGFIENLDELPFPARDLVPLKQYSPHLESRSKPATTLITSRGCPFHCIYCSKPAFGNQFRARSPENILKEMKLLKETRGIKELIFYDDSFTLDRKRIIKLCELLLAKNLDIKWKCETRVNLVDEELLLTMKKAGCYRIGYGIESGNQKILNILKKGITIEEIKKAVKMTKKAGIEILGYFMLGIPGETEKEIKETINFAKGLNIDFAQFSIATAYPGTELYQIAQSQEKIPNNWETGSYALTGQKNIISLCELDSSALQKYLKTAYRSFYFRPAYIRQKIKNINSFSDVSYYLKGLKSLIKI